MEAFARDIEVPLIDGIKFPKSYLESNFFVLGDGQKDLVVKTEKMVKTMPREELEKSCVSLFERVLAEINRGCHLKAYAGGEDDAYENEPNDNDGWLRNEDGEWVKTKH